MIKALFLGLLYRTGRIYCRGNRLGQFIVEKKLFKVCSTKGREKELPFLLSTIQGIALGQRVFIRCVPENLFCCLGK